jgi:hypothetical protein
MKTLFGIILIVLAGNIDAQSEQTNGSVGTMIAVSTASNGPEVGLYQLAFGKVTSNGFLTVEGNKRSTVYFLKS